MTGPESSPLLSGPPPGTGAFGAPSSQAPGQSGTAGIAGQAPAPQQLPATGANVAAQLLGALGSLGLGTTALRVARRPTKKEEPWLVG